MDDLSLLDQHIQAAQQPSVVSPPVDNPDLQLLDAHLSGKTLPSTSTSPKGVAEPSALNAYREGIAGGLLPGGQRITSAMGAVGAKAADLISSNPVLTDQSVPDLYNQAQLNTKATAEAHPTATALGNATGILWGAPLLAKAGTAIAGSLGAAYDTLPVVGAITRGAASGAAQEGASILTKVANLGLQGLKNTVVASPVVAAYGAGNAAPYQKLQGADDALKYAPVVGNVGPVLGAAYNGIKNVISPEKQPLQQATEDVVGAFKDKAQQFFANQLAQRPDLAEALNKATTLQQAADAVGIKLTTAESLAYGSTDPLLRQQGALSSNPVTGGAEAQRIAGRAGQIENAYVGVAKNLDPAAETYDDAAQAVIQRAAQAGKDVTKQLSEQATPLYDQAKSANQSMASPELDRILERPAAVAAMKQARVNMQNKGLLMGVSNPQYTQDAIEAGVPRTGYGVASGLKLQSLDEVKSALDDQYRAAVADVPPGQPTSKAAQAILQTKKDLVAEMDNLDVTKPTPSQLTQFRSPKAGPLNPKGAYAQAREIYSSNSDALDMRKHIGDLANIDPNNVKSVATELLKGTPATAQLTADALGPEGSKAAASAIIHHAVLYNRGSPETLVNMLDKNNATAQILKIYLGEDNANALDTVNEAARRVLMGNKSAGSASATAPLLEAQSAIKKGAEALKDTAGDAATGGLYSKAKALVGLGEKAPIQDPKYLQDLHELLTTPKGLDLAKQISALQSKSLATTAMKRGLQP